MRNFQQTSKDESNTQISKNVEEPKRASANVQDNLYQQSQSDSLTSNQNGIVALQKAYGNRFIQRMFSDSQVSDEEPSWSYQPVEFEWWAKKPAHPTRLIGRENSNIIYVEKIICS